MRLRRRGLRSVVVGSFVLLSGWSARPADAQTGRVYGRVLDQATGQPIRSATVVAESAQAIPGTFTAISDDKGRYAMLGLRSGAWVVTAAAKGYGVVSLAARIQAVVSGAPIDFKLSKLPEPEISPLARLDVPSFQADIDAAQALFDSGKPDEAIAAYSRLLERLPMLTSLHLQIARAHRQKHDLVAAAAEFEHVPAGDSRYEAAQIELGLLEMERGNLALADKVLGAIVRDAGASPEAYCALGDVRSASRQFDDAIGWYRKASDVDPSWPRAYERLGRVSKEQGNRAAAIDFLQRAISLDPDGPDGTSARALLAALSKS